MLSINRINDGKLLTNQKDILNEVKNFYANVYAENPQEMDLCGRISTTSSNGAQKTCKQKHMLQKISKTFSPQNKQVCEEPLTIQEIKKAISTLENIKSPGNDGLTGEFYAPGIGNLYLQKKVIWTISLTDDLSRSLTATIKY